MRFTRPALAILIGVAGVAVSVISQDNARERIDLAVVGVPQLIYLGVGLLIVDAHPRHVVGRLAIAGTLVSIVGSGLLEPSAAVLDADPGNVAALLAATIGTAGRGFGWMLLVLVLPLVFPDGLRSGPPRVVRWAWRLSRTALGTYLAVSVFSPRQTDLRIDGLDNPIGVPHAWSGPFELLAVLLLASASAAVGLAVVCVASRWRHGSPLRRQQLLWFALSFSPPVALFVLSLGDLARPWMFGLATLPVPIAIAVAVFQKRLYDVHLAVNRSLAYGSLSVTIAVLYAVTVGGVGAMLRRPGAPWLPWVAAGVVAVVFTPLREALQAAANRVTYGQWSQPDEVLARTRRRLADLGDLPALLSSVTAELVEGLGLDHVEIVGPTGASIAASGAVPALVDELPLTAFGETVGCLRWDSRPLRDVDRELMAELAAQLGAVLHAEALVASVRAAQEGLVLAREEERRRLRRDLHDGLGPALAGLTLQVDAQRNEPSDDGLLALRGRIQETVIDVRRIVEGLRPPALDDLGLVEAVRQLAARVGTDSLTVTTTTDDLPRLSAATEVAAYRIVQEALTNVGRHAEAAVTSVSLECGPHGLVVQVVDDGTGDLRRRADGVGLGSMRERAEEIGGSFDLSARPGRGTTVRAVLPLQKDVRA